MGCSDILRGSSRPAPMPPPARHDAFECRKMSILSIHGKGNFQSHLCPDLAPRLFRFGERKAVGFMV
eukprot:15192395-Alexandrium_andersonii.AAC.1